MLIIILIIYILIAIVLSFISGILWARFYGFLKQRTIKKNSKKLLKGEISNKIELDDGRLLDVEKFILPLNFDESEKKKIVKINLKGGVTKKIENAKKRNDNGKILEKTIGIRRKKNRSYGKKKRIIGIRNKLFRRYG